MLALVLAASGGALAASAAGAPTPTPSPALGAPSPTPDPTVAEPTVARVADSATGTVSVGGTAQPGARVKVALTGDGSYRALCDGVVTGVDGRWSCRAAVPSGADWTAVVRDLDHPDLADVSSSSFSVLAPPTVDGGLLVGAKLTGTAFPGATVTATSSAGARATTTAAADGSWVAVLPADAFPTGSPTMTATQSSSAVPAVPTSAASARVSVQIDRAAPAAPVVISPSPGQRVTTQPVTFAGTGDEGARATVYVDSSPVCQSTVVSGRWSCRSEGSTFPTGSRVVQASLVDAAGNFGPPSAAFSVTVGGATASAAPPVSGATPSPTRSPSATPPPRPTPGPTAPVEPGPSATAAPGVPGAPSDDGGDRGSGGAGGVPSAGGGPEGGWATATTFGRDLPTLSQTLGGPSWPLAALLGLAFVALVVGPARLAAGAVRGRGRRAPGAVITGRNRGVELPTSFSGGTIDLRVAVGATIVAGAAVTALAAGVDDQVQYARLFAGIALGLILLNGLAVVLPTVLVARRLGRAVRVRVSPGLLLAAVVACAATRLLSLDPPLVLGALLVGTLTVASTTDADARHPSHSTADPARPTDDPAAREQGIAALAQLAALIVLPFAAWTVHGLVTGSGFWAQLGRETLATVCLAGLGSLVVQLLPLGSLPGRQVWSWSKTAYSVLAVVGVSVAAAVFVGAPSSSFPLPTLLLASLVAALLAVAAWLWTTYVEPARRSL